jgi:hypothetical protein
LKLARRYLNALPKNAQQIEDQDDDEYAAQSNSAPHWAIAAVADSSSTEKHN